MDKHKLKRKAFWLIDPIPPWSYFGHVPASARPSCGRVGRCVPVKRNYGSSNSCKVRCRFIPGRGHQSCISGSSIQLGFLTLEKKSWLRSPNEAYAKTVSG